ncbi:MAG: flavin reductase, partial [Clostridia bacterium]|nr:flavin reductase [Clostridia bacterium]
MATNQIKAKRDDNKSLFSIPYGLFLVTSSLDSKANGLIVNTVTQVTNTPNRVAVTINKDNYSHTIIKETGILNVNCL